MSSMYFCPLLHFSPDWAIIRDREAQYVIPSFVKIGRGESRNLRRVCSDFLSTLPKFIVRSG